MKDSSNKNNAHQDTIEWTQIKNWIFPNGELPNDNKHLLKDILCRRCVVFSSSSYYYGQNSNYSSEESFWNPAEFAFASFSFKKGLGHIHSSFIDPGFDSGFGYKAAISESAKKYGIKEPTQSPSPIDKRKMYKGFIEPFLNIVRHVNKKLPKEEADKAILVFVPLTCPDQLKMTADCFKFCSDITGEELPTLHFLSMAELFRFVMNESMRCLGRDERLSLKMSESVLLDTSYEYSSDIGCAHHRMEEYQDQVIYCSNNVIVRSIYYVLRSFDKTFNKKRKKDARPGPAEGLFTLEKHEIDLLIGSIGDEGLLKSLTLAKSKK